MAIIRIVPPISEIPKVPETESTRPPDVNHSNEKKVARPPARPLNQLEDESPLRAF